MNLPCFFRRAVLSRTGLAALLLPRALLLCLSGPVRGETAEADISTHLIAIAICPPDHALISPEACHNTTDRLASSMSAAMNIPTQNIRVFVDEDAAGPNVLQAISDYSATVGPQDEILMYVTGHGAPYADWVNAWVQDAGMREMMAELRPRGEYLLQFWTETPDTVPGLAVVNESLMPVTRLLDAFGDFEGRLALIVESCSSGLLLENPDYLAQRYPFLDHLPVTSGPDQGSNLTG